MRPEVKELLDKINALVPKVIKKLEMEAEAATKPPEPKPLTTPHK